MHTGRLVAKRQRGLEWELMAGTDGPPGAEIGGEQIGYWRGRWISGHNLAVEDQEEEENERWDTGMVLSGYKMIRLNESVEVKVTRRNQSQSVLYPPAGHAPESYLQMHRA
jgi:hypothetical protein